MSQTETILALTKRETLGTQQVNRTNAHLIIHILPFNGFSTSSFTSWLCRPPRLTGRRAVAVRVILHHTIPPPPKPRGRCSFPLLNAFTLLFCTHPEPVHTWGRRGAE